MLEIRTDEIWGWLLRNSCPCPPKVCFSIFSELFGLNPHRDGRGKILGFQWPICSIAWTSKPHVLGNGHLWNWHFQFTPCSASPKIAASFINIGLQNLNPIFFSSTWPFGTDGFVTILSRKFAHGLRKKCRGILSTSIHCQSGVYCIWMFMSYP